MGKRGARCKQLLDDCKETRGCQKLKEEALYCSVWRTRFGMRLRTSHKTDYVMNEHSFEESGTSDPITWHHIPDLNPQLHC
jgi:hypothetical protein